MAGSQKKTAKGRLDKFYKLAKEQGFRSRAAFKLIQLNKKYGFLEKSKVVIDLCAAPGGWLQVASKQCKPGALIIGVDLVPIRPIPNCITFAEDINSDKCRAQLRQHMKTWKADCVIHDGAPNVGTAWLQDAYSQAELVLMSLKLACEFLIPGGTFVTKVFRSKDYNSLLYTFNQLFSKVEATKPQASRNVSAEIFVVCMGFKAPLKLDPKLLNPKSVFEDLPDVPQNQEAKVFHPERRKRQREGYEEGNYTQHNVKPISEFVLAQDPIQILGLTHEFTFAGEEDQQFKKMDITTTEIKACCADLQVLGKKDFRALLRWRTAARETIGIGKKDEEEEVVQVEPLDEDEQIDQDIERIDEAQKAKLRREKRRANEKKIKEITRMQMGMTSAMDIGSEQAAQGEDAMFALKDTEKTAALGKIAQGKEFEVEVESEESGDEEIELEDQLDLMYNQYRERKAESDAKYKAKRARKDKEDDEWHGIEDEKAGSDEDEAEIKPQDVSVGSDSESSDEEGEDLKLSTSLEKEEAPVAGGLTKRAALFFNQELFKDLEQVTSEEELLSKSGSPDAESGKVLPPLVAAKKVRPEKKEKQKKKIKDSAFEEVPRAEYSDAESEDDNPRAKGQPSVDIVTAEAMTLAHQIASKERSKSDIIDDGFNRLAFYDKDGAPEWFLDDENVHNRPNLPITKAASEALREKMRAVNARPIKKILEAKGRKKQRALRVLGKINQKADVINETEDLTERQKAQSITRLLNRASKSKPKNKVQVIVASGKNKGQGRPSGVKGPYKSVDKRLKKETRALKRVAKKARGGR
ncbi:AdoMet-dependent rRNA methyltransferase spb1 [Taphrina deformans PYCC 5710]|uniref:AdoMet-dependent rRNA methyltransferase spb1 n=1 Tax=Taphrina deformans (strain PYCC 5710 / ATCC 11124 / CBS 356.35 / IMI 108563 / JCM 9778 / NBRC 8474) TaxID=1097556 RepID=R4X7Q7_TAPDE|nr:AdoMet-dependent rRNA methyltransferase spb1 [Taphrina deformans PYCC 5710]|eukprot:CCG81481.1 AdoMet-dependent rRNA methyltransferase spb1 [Taphrina deformans PYCC 5710]